MTPEDVRVALEAAETAGDAEAILALLADDAVVMVPDFPVCEGKDACAAFILEVVPQLAAEFQRHASYRSLKVAVFGDTAVDYGTFSVAVTARADAQTNWVTGKYLWTLARADATGWRISRLIISRDGADEEG